MVTINTRTKRWLTSWNFASSTLSGKTETKASKPKRLTPSHSDSIHKTIKSQRTSWLKCRCLFKREFCSITTSIHHRCFSKPPWGNLHQSACVDLCWALHQSAYAGRPSLYHVRVPVQNHCGASIGVLCRWWLVDTAPQWLLILRDTTSSD